MHIASTRLKVATFFWHTPGTRASWNRTHLVCWLCSPRCQQIRRARWWLNTASATVPTDRYTSLKIQHSSSQWADRSTDLCNNPAITSECANRSISLFSKTNTFPVSVSTDIRTSVTIQHFFQLMRQPIYIPPWQFNTFPVNAPTDLHTSMTIQHFTC